jgi:hypothetical protein
MLIFKFFHGTGVSTKGFVLTKQVLYCLSHTPVSFAVVIFEIGSHELFALALNHDPPNLSLPSS